MDIAKVHARGVAQLNAAYQEAQYEFSQAQLADDVDGAAAAANKMAGIQATFAQLNGMARQATSPPRGAAPANKFGLSPDESGIAKASGISDEEYAKNKRRLWEMRQRGEYPMPGEGRG